MNRLQVTANIALIVVSCIAGYVLIDRHLIDRRALAGAGSVGQQQSSVGKRISGAEFNDKRVAANVYVVFATTCHFCRDSLAFYKGLARAQQHTTGKVQITFLAIREPVAQVRQFLAENGVEVGSVARLPPDLYISGTPTILVAGADGVITAQYLGRLTADREKSLVGTIQKLCDSCGFDATSS